MDTPVIDQTRLETFLARAVGDLSAGYGGVMVSLGSKLGLYKAMAGTGPISAAELAAREGARGWRCSAGRGGALGRRRRRFAGDRSAAALLRAAAAGCARPPANRAPARLEWPVPIPQDRLRMHPADSTTELVPVRGLRYNVRRWGPPDAPRIFLLHGWMDASATFQFVVEAFARDWHVIAPDWRGFGASDWLGRPYWFPDYYADLEALLAHYSPDAPVQLVGHSMGGSVAAIYAGLRPARVVRLAVLDFLGLNPPADADPAEQLRAWLDAQAEPPRLRAYPDHAALARRLRAANVRLSAERADFLARNVGRVRDDGQVEIAGDPWHRVPSPFLYRVDDAMAAWRKVSAPVLVMVAAEGFVVQRFGADGDEFRRRVGCFSDVRVTTITDAGHNLQHDQPERVAAALEAFLLRP